MGLVALLSLAGCQTFYLVPQQPLARARAAPANAVVFAIPEKRGGCSLDTSPSATRPPVFLKLSSIEPIQWAASCPSCTRVRNLWFLLGDIAYGFAGGLAAISIISEYAPCSGAQCGKNHEGAVQTGWISGLLAVAGIAASIKGGLDAKSRPWEVPRGLPAYHYYDLAPGDTCQAAPALPRARALLYDGRAGGSPSVAGKL